MPLKKRQDIGYDAAIRAPFVLIPKTVVFFGLMRDAVLIELVGEDLVRINVILDFIIPVPIEFEAA
jgi:hypothetical protein